MSYQTLRYLIAGRSRIAVLGVLVCGCAGPVAAQPVITPSTPPVVKQGTSFTFTANEAVTWSLVAGSLGSINATTGVYTAPAGIAPRNVVGGCQAHANSHVDNTRIDAMPVHARSTLWMSNPNIGAGQGMAIGPDFPVNEILSSSANTVAMNFYYTPGNNATYTVPSIGNWAFENG